MEIPVEGDTPGILYGLCKLLPEVLKCHILILTQAQGIPAAQTATCGKGSSPPDPDDHLPDVGDVVSVSQLRDATGEHHGEQVQEERPSDPHL